LRLRERLALGIEERLDRLRGELHGRQPCPPVIERPGRVELADAVPELEVGAHENGQRRPVGQDEKARCHVEGGRARLVEGGRARLVYDDRRRPCAASVGRARELHVPHPEVGPDHVGSRGYGRTTGDRFRLISLQRGATVAGAGQVRPPSLEWLASMAVVGGSVEMSALRPLK
jgi:hypothetical protein